MIRDDEHTRLLGELHRTLSSSVPKKDYDILTNCLRSCRNMIDEAVLALEGPFSKRNSASVAKNLRIFLNVLDGHIHDPWVMDPKRDGAKADYQHWNGSGSINNSFEERIEELRKEIKK